MKRKLILMLGIIFLFSISIINFTSSIGEITYCCEKLVISDETMGYCQETFNQNECSTGIKDPLTGEKYKVLPTSCQNSGYCKEGTCITKDGICMPNTPQSRCNQNLGGTWSEQSIENLERCQLGCCVLEEESMITTSIKCSTEAANRRIESIFRKDIRDIGKCAELSNLDEKGACVFEQNYQKKCLVLSKKQCLNIAASRATSDIFENYYGNMASLSGIESSSVSFYAGSLCSDPDLDTGCLPSKSTTKYNGKVYFLDSCKNLANIYWNSKFDDPEYWSKIKKGDESCSLTWNKNIITNSKECGNCDLNSLASFESASGKKATIGNYICKPKDCTDDRQFGVKEFYNKYGRYPYSGESWCFEDKFLTPFNLLEEYGIENSSKIDLTKQNLPGSQYYKLQCQSGKVLKPELCMPRADICAQTLIDSGKKDSSGKSLEFYNAVCAANFYEDCFLQTSKKECEDSESRSCTWVVGYSLQQEEDTGKQIVYEDKNENEEKDKGEKYASCIPKIPPAHKQYCEFGNYFCQVKYEKRGAGNVKQTEHCVENCYCLKDFTGVGILKNSAKNKYEKTNPPFNSYNEWKNFMDNLCNHLGDCGNKTNYMGYSGEYKGKIIESSGAKKI